MPGALAAAHCLYLFNRAGECVHYAEWARPRPMQSTHADDAKMLFGLLFSLKGFCAKLDPSSGSSASAAPAEFHAFCTSTYKLHALETPTGLRLVLETDAAAGDARDALWHIYDKLYVPLVAHNPAVAVAAPHGASAAPPAFAAAVDAYVCSLVRGG